VVGLIVWSHRRGSTAYSQQLAQGGGRGAVSPSPILPLGAPPPPPPQGGDGYRGTLSDVNATIDTANRAVATADNILDLYDTYAN
jgi:hypothetical protein